MGQALKLRPTRSLEDARRATRDLNKAQALSPGVESMEKARQRMADCPADVQL